MRRLKTSPPSPTGTMTARLRSIEHKRRMIRRMARNAVLPIQLLARFTYASFRLEDLSIRPADVSAALARPFPPSPGTPPLPSPGTPGEGRGGGQGRGERSSLFPKPLLRSTQSLRIRNHLAILRHIELMNRRRQELTVPIVVRWYTSIGCGLSMSGLDYARSRHLEQHLRQINSPQLRLQRAVGEIASLHAHLLADPVFPGFNGILARLLLQYHLARCQLAPVLFDPGQDQIQCLSPSTLMPRLLELIDESYSVLLSSP